MAMTATLVQVLGGPEVLRESAPSPEQLRKMVREGLPFASFEALADRFHFGREALSAALTLPMRTLMRRKEGRLRPDESDRLVRLARIAAQAVEVLGTTEKASQWLQRPNRALGGETPLSLLDTDLGSRQVEEVLQRIELGVYS